MIDKIKMQDVASYKAETFLTTDKKVNLIYGLNGTGKSTLSNFLYDRDNTKFSGCSLSPASPSHILVYNQAFIHDNFYFADSLKGIFSLSQENKAAEQKIADAQQRITALELTLSAQKVLRAKAESEFSKKRQIALEKVWKIKIDYTGGDRVFEYCLDGLKGQKEKLFSYLLEISKPSQELKKSIVDLKKEIEALTAEDATSLPLLPKIVFAEHGVESNPLMQQAITGNKDSVVASLMEKLENSDWVKQGLQYIPEHLDENGSPCPFCQENTIKQSLIDNITDYFDESYEAAIAELVALQKSYRAALLSIPELDSFTSHLLATQLKSELEKAYSSLSVVLKDNEKRIEEKLKSPRDQKFLNDSSTVVQDLNNQVDKINILITEHNAKIANKSASLQALKTYFWQIMRWNYDQTLSRYLSDKAGTDQKLRDIDKDTGDLSTKINGERQIIAEAQKETVNIEQSIININSRLSELGMEDFEIKKHSESLYRIVRSGDSDDAFHSLSEGEKMIISFLYFCELCKGKQNAQDTDVKKIAVIDDPISSLSHIYIFNIGRLIKKDFFESERFAQVFVLTHSLYFFYELTDNHHERRKKNQKLFRIIKNADGSRILDMKYEEIQNDYQSYWEIVKDTNQPPALVANCMRNIVEYFFGFVKKQDLNKVFQEPALQENRFQAFCRYINRESHSLGQNIFDLKEFDYDAFRDGLRLVFEATGFSEHYEQMIKN